MTTPIPDPSTNEDRVSLGDGFSVTAQTHKMGPINLIRKTGTVVRWDHKSKFGFISAGMEEDIFVHHSEIKMDGFRELRKGQVVTFFVQHTEKGWRALQVVIEQRSPSASPRPQAQYESGHTVHYPPKNQRQPDHRETRDFRPDFMTNRERKSSTEHRDGSYSRLRPRR